MKIKSKNIFFILALFMVLLCCFSAVSASEDVYDSVSVSDDVAVDEVVSEVDSDDESISVQENEEIESSDDVNNESLEVSDVEEVDDADDSSSVLSAEENDNEVSGQTLLMSNFAENILKDAPTEIYVNVSIDGNDPDEGDYGYSWETAFGSKYGITRAISRIADGGIIYLADGVYSNKNFNDPKNITFIGQSNETQLSFYTTIWGAGAPNATYTFINMTIYHGVSKNGMTHYNNYERNINFINCSIVGDITIEKAFNQDRDEIHIEESEYARTYFINFDNCVFKNINTENAVITLYNYGQVTFTNSNFEDITADSIVSKNGTFKYDDGIYFNDCKFNNCNVKGIVDVPGAADIETYCVIEDCDYDFDANLNVETTDNHNYVNATKLKVVAVDSAVDISSSEKGVVVITLTDGTNPIAGATVKYTVNGGDEQTVTTGEDGKATISGLTGEVTIAVNYEGNESFNAISDSKFFNFTEEPVVPPKVATKITAPKVTATYNVAKKLVITLTDKDGKVLANKKVTVKVGTISKTLTTNAKGQVSLNVATLVPKTYTATVKFAGDDGYLASSLSPKVVVSKAKPQIVAKAKTFKVKIKTKKYTVTLKNNKGKVMKKVKLTLKVGKKTYKATTNSKGKATFKITKLNKKGKYTATIKFAGSKYYKALSKKAKITVKK